ncbi:MAG: hypothetical protein HOP11_03670 [Saprospiraceae bacterium]|nr:hypothetical protein [Saprospiraceae bacterium]
MHRKLPIVLYILVLFIPNAFARKVFVSSTSGNDKNSGSSISDAYQTLQYASDQSQAGDTIFIASGFYKSTSKHLLKISRSGEKDKWITYKNLESKRPVLYVSNEAAISIFQSSYIIIEGLEFTSDPDFEKRISNPESINNLTSKGNAIQIERSRGPQLFSHHVKLKDNYIHDCPGNGIDIFSADYIEIVYNNLHANGKYSMVSNCGIRIQFLNTFDELPGDHIIMQYNEISNQRTTGSLSKVNNSCEENYGASGIVLRNNRYDQQQALKPNYLQKINIGNNLIYLNGGQAIDVFETNNLFIHNNTCYQNNQNEESKCGEIQCNKTKDILAQNNIFYARIGMNGSSVKNYENVSFLNNLYYNTKGYFQGQKDLNEDPMFTMLDHHRGVFNFELRPKSPAINTGNSSGISSIDFSGSKRVISYNVDLGAMEYTGALPKPRDSEQMKLDRRSITISWQASYSQTTGQIIVLNSKGDYFSALLFNNTGKVVSETFNINGSKRGIEFDVSSLPSGLYFLVAFSETENYTSKYFVKNNFTNLLNTK